MQEIIRQIEEIRDRVDMDIESPTYPLTRDVYDLADSLLALCRLLAKQFPQLQDAAPPQHDEPTR